MLNRFPPTCLESSSFQCMIWALGQMLCFLIQKEKNPILFPVSQRYLLQQCHSFTCQKNPRSAGCNCIFSLCRLQPALPCVLDSDQEPAGLLLPAPLSAELPRAWPGAAAGKQQDRSSNLHMGVFFVSPWGCAWQVLLAGPPAP